MALASLRIFSGSVSLIMLNQLEWKNRSTSRFLRRAALTSSSRFRRFSPACFRFLSAFRLASFPIGFMGLLVCPAFASSCSGVSPGFFACFRIFLSSIRRAFSFCFCP